MSRREHVFSGLELSRGQEAKGGAAFGDLGVSPLEYAGMPAGRISRPKFFRSRTERGNAAKIFNFSGTSSCGVEESMGARSAPLGPGGDRSTYPSCVLVQQAVALAPLDDKNGISLPQRNE